jgi:serine carboxypeptidase-like clade 1
MSSHSLYLVLASLLLLGVVSAQLSSTAAAAEQQQPAWQATHGPITSVPGYEGQLPSKHYGGYITVGHKQLYYYMVESERNPATDPVV